MSDEGARGLVETLWDELAYTNVDGMSAKVVPYRPGAAGRPFEERRDVPVPCDPLLEGMSFFPVGTGLFGSRVGVPLPPVTPGGAMIVAHNWGSEDDYAQVRNDHHYGAYLATNRRSVALLMDAGIDPRRCFFTNAYPCLIRGTSRLGSLEIRAGAALDEFSHRFFLRQCQLFRPSLLVALGKPAAMALARWLNIHVWRNAWTFRTLCAADGCVAVPSLDGCAAAVVVPHPSMPNWRYYSFGTQSGRQAGVQALADAWGRR